MIKRIAKITGVGIIASFLLASAGEAAQWKFVGASQFDERHPFTQLMRKFEQLVQSYYGGPDTIKFDMHLNSELGLEKDYFNYMAQGISVDYAVVAPPHMSTYSKWATLYDPPGLWKSGGHMSRTIWSGVLKPIEDDILKRADVRILGYGGGATRHLIVNKPVTNMAAIKNLSVRVQGAPIWTKAFRAAGMAPTVIAYAEVYNGIQTGRISAAENEAAGIQQMKFYEVGPNIAMTGHAMTVRPLCFSNKTFGKLPADLQAAILQAGRDAGVFGRVVEGSEDAALLAKMESDGLLKRIPFTERDKLSNAMAPVVEAFFVDVGAADLFKAIRAIP